MTKETTNKREFIPTNKKQFRHYVHSAFTVKDGPVSVSVDEHGKTKIIEEHGGEEYSEVAVSASVINILNKLLEFVKNKDLEIQINESQVYILQHNNDSDDEIRISAEFIEKVSGMILTTRKIEMKDEPFKEDIN
jgi:hypothetical protein